MTREASRNLAPRTKPLDRCPVCAIGDARVFFSAADFRTLDLPRNKHQPIVLNHVFEHFGVTRASCGLVLLHIQFAAYRKE